MDARYIREKPSGIGTYVQALVERLPHLAPGDRFLFWAHPLAHRPLSPAGNTADVVVQPGPNSPLPVWWPTRYAPFADVDLFHSPHNMMPRALPCPAVVTVHDVMAIERPDLHLQGIERLAKSTYYPAAVWRALREAVRIIAPTEDAANRLVALEPSARRRTRVILEAADPVFCPAPRPEEARQRAEMLIGSDAPYLLVVGANSATKRHADAVEAPGTSRQLLLPGNLSSKHCSSFARCLIRRTTIQLRFVRLIEIVGFPSPLCGAAGSPWRKALAILPRRPGRILLGQGRSLMKTATPYSASPTSDIPSLDRLAWRRCRS